VFANDRRDVGDKSSSFKRRSLYYSSSRLKKVFDPAEYWLRQCEHLMSNGQAEEQGIDTSGMGIADQGWLSLILCISLVPKLDPRRLRDVIRHFFILARRGWQREAEG
jgi:hypothetical protein